ncbi:MAG: hypothetical protein KF842_06365 [Caulobacter sp.]|nr:hypothetical protein [Caulobacter sp.]
MAASRTAIGNAALGKLGQGAVLSFDDPDDRARWLKSRFDDIRDLCLRANRWHFAMARARLSAEATAPAFGYQRQFPMPADCLRLAEVGGVAFDPDSGSPVYALEGGRILTDAAAPLDIRYVRRVEDVAGWDPLFAEAVACRLAAELAEKLTQSSTKREAALRDYQLSLREAFRVNAIEAAPETTIDGAWLSARF